MEEIDNYDPFKQHTQEVLDTDYDNYLFLYSCKESVENVNKEGMTQKEIEYLKAQDIEKKMFVGVKAKDTIHMYLKTLGGNKKFVKFVHVLQKQLENEKSGESH